MEKEGVGACGLFDSPCNLGLRRGCEIHAATGEAPRHVLREVPSRDVAPPHCMVHCVALVDGNGMRHPCTDVDCEACKAPRRVECQHCLRTQVEAVHVVLLKYHLPQSACSSGALAAGDAQGGRLGCLACFLSRGLGVSRRLGQKGAFDRVLRLIHLSHFGIQQFEGVVPNLTHHHECEGFRRCRGNRGAVLGPQ